MCGTFTNSQKKPVMEALIQMFVTLNENEIFSACTHAHISHDKHAVRTDIKRC